LAAIDMGDAIEAAAARLGEYPESGRPGRVRGTRELVVTGTPYVIVYRLETSAAIILRALHGAQRWPGLST
jgi:toxin ParE1/3/4